MASLERPKCVVCWELLSLAEMAHSPCKKCAVDFCTKCLKTLFANAEKEDVLEVQCPNPHCKTQFDADCLKLDKSKVKIWVENELKHRNYGVLDVYADFDVSDIVKIIAKERNSALGILRRKSSAWQEKLQTLKARAQTVDLTEVPLQPQFIGTASNGEINLKCKYTDLPDQPYGIRGRSMSAPNYNDSIQMGFQVFHMSDDDSDFEPGANIRSAKSSVARRRQTLGPIIDEDTALEDTHFESPMGSPDQFKFPLESTTTSPQYSQSTTKRESNTLISDISEMEAKSQPTSPRNKLQTLANALFRLKNDADISNNNSPRSVKSQPTKSTRTQSASPSKTPKKRRSILGKVRKRTSRILSRKISISSHTNHTNHNNHNKPNELKLGRRRTRSKSDASGQPPIARHTSFQTQISHVSTASNRTASNRTSSLTIPNPGTIILLINSQQTNSNDKRVTFDNKIHDLHDLETPSTPDSRRSNSQSIDTPLPGLGYAVISNSAPMTLEPDSPGTAASKFPYQRNEEKSRSYFSDGDVVGMSGRDVCDVNDDDDDRSVHSMSIKALKIRSTSPQIVSLKPPKPTPTPTISNLSPNPTPTPSVGSVSELSSEKRAQFPDTPTSNNKTPTVKLSLAPINSMQEYDDFDKEEKLDKPENPLINIDVIMNDDHVIDMSDIDMNDLEQDLHMDTLTDNDMELDESDDNMPSAMPPGTLMTNHRSSHYLTNNENNGNAMVYITPAESPVTPAVGDDDGGGDGGDDGDDIEEQHEGQPNVTTVGQGSLKLEHISVKKSTVSFSTNAAEVPPTPPTPASLDDDLDYDPVTRLDQIYSTPKRTTSRIPEIGINNNNNTNANNKYMNDGITDNDEDGRTDTVQWDGNGCQCCVL